MKNHYIITKHAMERYSERINFNQKRVRDAIMKDLRATDSKRIITIDNKKHIFYKNYREFVLKKSGNKEVLITVIKHKREDKEKVIKRRLKEKMEIEKNIDKK